MAAERIIGIDLGTSTSFVKVKRYQDRYPADADRFETKAVVFDGRGSIAAPTVVQRAGEQFWFGCEAEVPKPGGALYTNFKVELESDDPNVRAQARELTERFFHFLFQKYDEQRLFFGDPTDKERTLVSYPAKWREETCRFMLRAAADAGFRNVAGMDEATAAIHAVMLQESDDLLKKGYLASGRPSTLLLIDMGAGTTDLALCRYTPGEEPKTEILSTWPAGGGKILFGGREMDELLCGMLSEQLRRGGMRENVVESLKKLRMGEIRAWKEHVVSDRFSGGQPVESCPVLDGLYMLMGETPPPFPPFTRKGFEEAARPLLTRYVQLIKGCIAHTAETVPDFRGGTDIELAILTGGHSQWYFAGDILTGALEGFGEIDLPRLRFKAERVLRMARPQETVSFGLALSGIFPAAQAPVQAPAAPKVEIPRHRYGNTPGNLSNGGMLAQQGDWIYYQNASDNRNLYKIKTDRTQKTRLSFGECGNICVMGDRVYYLEREKDGSRLYSVHTNGIGRAPLLEEKTFIFAIEDEWIYYFSGSDMNKIYKIRMDGTERTKLSDDHSHHRSLSVLDGWIYYENAEDGDKLYRIRTDGSGHKRLTDFCPICYCVSDGWVYYSKGWGNHLCRMRADGSDDAELGTDVAQNINADGDWIYYTDRNSMRNLFKARRDGSERTCLVGATPNGGTEHPEVSVSDGWVYFVECEEVHIFGNSRYCNRRIRVNGHENQKF